MPTQFQTRNPFTNEVTQEFSTLDAPAAEALLSRAHESFLLWRQTSPIERVKLYSTFGEVLGEHKDQLARLITSEMGKPLGQAYAEIDLIAEIMHYYQAHGQSMLAADSLQVPGFSEVRVSREPIGVVLGIEPWNAPMYQAIRTAAPNLMLGNTVIIKPAEQCAGSTLLLEKIFRDTGFPDYVFQTGLLGHDHIAQYIADHRVRAVGFTGSDRTGRRIGEMAGQAVKPVVLELGGSDAFLVLDSADAVKAAATASSIRLFIGGQVCTSPKRMIVTDKVADEFIAEVSKAFQQQVIGDPLDPATTVGPLCSAAAADAVQAQLQDAIDKGATVIVNGGQLEPGSALFRPAVITDITPSMRVYSEEVFGPIASVFRVPDAAAAIELANDTDYGLAATVFAEDLAEAKATAQQLETGMVGINAFLGGPVEIPFGGTKSSGVGRELGPQGMDAFANIKTYGQA